MPTDIRYKNIIHLGSEWMTDSSEHHPSHSAITFLDRIFGDGTAAVIANTALHPPALLAVDFEREVM